MIYKLNSFCAREKKMTYRLFEEVVLLKNITEKGLNKGDVATIVEYHPVMKIKNISSKQLICKWILEHV